MSTTAARIEQRAYELIRQSVARLDKDIADAEQRVKGLRTKRNTLQLIRDSGLSELTKEQRAELGRALILASGDEESIE
jgi:hypothetical protein